MLSRLLLDDHLDDDAVARLLALARSRLGMDLAWFSRFDGDTQVVEVLDPVLPDLGPAAGDRLPLADSYCARVATGVLPAAIPDTAANPITAALPVTRQFGIGAYLAAELRGSSGEYYGTLCCFNRQPLLALDDRDAHFLQLLADLLGDALDVRLHTRRADDAVVRRVSDVLAAGGPVMVFQAVHGIADRQVVGWEALARFPAGHGGPAQWFADAHRVGLGLDLEVAAVRQALASSPLLPGAGFLAVNLSAQTVLDADLAMLTEPAVAARVVVEITEHEQVADYVPLLERMAQLRDAGVRFAADDAGAGYAGLRHLVELRPDVIKMDRDLTHAMDRDPARIAMATTLASFALATGAVLIAEGIETRGELLAAARLGIPFGQGYHLSRPVSPADAGGSGEPGADGRPPVGTVTT